MNVVRMKRGVVMMGRHPSSPSGDSELKGGTITGGSIGP